MKNVQTASTSRLPIWRSAAAVLASIFTLSAQAGLTDISATPIVSTSAGLVKPNIMLLMDASVSMGRTHMPDEVETTTLITSIGYKSAQCNVLYYNPTQKYFLPKRADGTPFPAPVYTAAPYAGFGAYYPIPVLNTTNLSTSFQAYDESSLFFGVSHDPAQPAYYYTYAGPETLTYAGAPCTQLDTSAPSVGTPGGGVWTRVSVNALPAADQLNFAIWYSYYRTRLSLIKSAASLAFAPLNDTKRVGFITVEPKTAPTDAAINPIRYLKLNDFNIAQKNLWFNKIFSQTAQGTSPAREGLARVGRYYGGKQDSINTGMAATGVDDPVQYACQQNFAIMTTDGYWNGQEETPTVAGAHGGALQLDGVTLVGEQDGNLGDPYSVRPFYDGATADKKKITNKVNAYTDNICSLAGRYRSTYQTQKEVDFVTKDTSETSRRTIKYTTTESQDLAQTKQTTKLSQRTLQTKSQNVITTDTPTVVQYQIWKSMEQTTQVSEQYRLQQSQTLAQTFQTRQVSTQTIRKDEQWTIAYSQNVLKTTQYLQQKSHYMKGVQQVIMEQWKDSAWNGESWVVTDGDCVGPQCLRTQVFGPAAVDPSTCSVPYSVSADPSHVKTTCTPGAATLAYQPVPFCGPTGVSVGPQWTVQTCDLVVDQAATPLDGSCNPASPFQDGGSPYTIYTCTTPLATNQTTPVASCPGVLPAYGFPSYITTTCSQPPGPNNQPPTPTPACPVASNTNPITFVTTTCAKPTDTVPAPSPFCVSVDGSAPPYMKTTCTTTQLSNPPIGSADCHPDPVGGPTFTVITCPKVAVAPDVAPTAVDAATCVDGSTTGDPNYVETRCTNPPGTNNNNFVPVGCGGHPLGLTPAVGPPWITYNCTQPVNSSGFNDPSLCHADLGTVFPYLHTTCTTVPIGPPPAPVDPATCLADSVAAGPGFEVTHCVRHDLPPPDASICAAPPPPSAMNNWTVTECGHSLSYQSVLVCPGVLPAGQTCAATPFVPTYVAVCTPQIAGPGNDNVAIDCAPTETLFNGPVDPLTCAASAAGAVPVITCTTNAVAPYMVPTPVAAPCMGGTDPGTFVVTTCSHDPAHNFPPVASIPCVDGPPSTDPVTHITSQCTKSDVTDFIKTADCHDVVQVGTGPSVTCTTTHTLGTPDGSCSVGHSDAVSPFDTTEACHTVPGAVANAAVCAPGPGPGAGDLTICTEMPIAVNVPDATCVAVVDTTDGTGIRTHCSTLFGDGHLYTVKETDTVTTQLFSGPVQVGVDSVVTNTTPSVNVDGVCYSDPQPQFSVGVPPGPQPPVTIAGCGAWPCTELSHQDSGSENSLADVSQYYYKTDLRPLMDDVVKAAGTGPEDDKAPHQHMTTFVVGLGVSGVLNYQSDYQSAATTSDFKDIRSGAKDWPLWPDPSLVYNVFPYNAYNSPKSIDDYWHTAVNGRGRFFSASNPTSVIQGLGDALSKIDSVVASGAADAVSSLTPTPGDHAVYSTSYQSVFWEGDLEGKLLDLGTGAPGPAVWSAKTLLSARTFAACDNRKIFLIHNGNTLSNFTWNTDICPAGVPTGVLSTGLDATEQLAFGALNISLLSQYPLMSDGTGVTVDQQTAAKAPGNLVNFVRGQRGNEGFQSNSLTKLWRTRDIAGVLGDIVDSQPVYVKTPFASYQDANYDAFKAGNSGRTPMVYVGANDGMLHAFYATLDLLDPLHGQEAWAVIPSAVLPNLYKLGDDAYGRGGHQFFVDGTPVAADVADAGNNWKTILVGGLGAGGKGYYALDVTVPGAPPVPLWEFKQDPASCPAPAPAAMPAGTKADCNLGLTFGKPVVTKLAGTWVVMVTSGYNNINGVAGDGGGYLYVLNALTGEIIYKIATGAGDGVTPSGLGQINNYVDNVLIDNTTLRAYGGDMLGNMWRFDFQPAPSATLLGSAKDIGTNIQPITVRPELAELDGKPFVMFGTGRLLGSSDVTDVHVQSVYGLRDPLIGASPIYADPIRTVLRPLKITEVLDAVTPSDLSLASRSISCTGDAAACARPAGWVLDLAEAGERVNVEMKLVLGALVFTSNVPEDVPCSVGGHSFFNQLDFRDGTLIPGSSFSQYLSDTLNVGFNVLQLPVAAGQNNPNYVGLTRQSTATNLQRNVNPPQPPILGRRISWREVLQQ